MISVRNSRRVSLCLQPTIRNQCPDIGHWLQILIVTAYSTRWEKNMREFVSEQTRALLICLIRSCQAIHFFANLRIIFKNHLSARTWERWQRYCFLNSSLIQDLGEKDVNFWGISRVRRAASINTLSAPDKTGHRSLTLLRELPSHSHRISAFSSFSCEG